MPERKTPKKPLIFYYLISLAILLIINVVVLPTLMRRQMTEVDYSTFLKAVEENRVLEVEMSADTQEIAYAALDERGQRQTYVTVVMPDPNLLDRLQRSENNIRFSRVKPTQPNPILTYLFSLIVPALLIIGLGRLFSRQLQTRMGNMMSFGKSNARVYVKAQTGKTFADVAGQEEAKEALKEIVDFLHDPEKYTSIGAILPKGALWWPSRYRKTLLAQAVAGEAQVPFFSISGSEFVEMFVGLGAAKVRDLFEQATAKAPVSCSLTKLTPLAKSGAKGAFLAMMSGADLEPTPHRDGRL